MQWEDAPRPRVERGEVLIRVHAAGVNPLDWKVRAGLLNGSVQHRLPLILGWDVSGVVDEVGAGVSRFKKGEEVFAMSDPTRDGAYADYIAVREAAVAMKPKSLHHVRAAATPVSALAAWRSLFDLGQLQSGQRILIHGGSGGVGHFAVHLQSGKAATSSRRRRRRTMNCCVILVPMKPSITQLKNSKTSPTRSTSSSIPSAGRHRSARGACLRTAER